jgi:energy-converting hydrogenase Eha subunit E
MISRYFVIVLALGAALMRARDRAWVETIGLSMLALGLVLLRLAETRQQPLITRIAWVCFGLTVLAMAAVFQRDYLR